MSAQAGERWSAVPGDARYEVSDLGRVRRSTPGPCTSPGRVLKALPTRDGYLRVCLGMGGPYRRIHRLVLEAFVGPCPPGMSCRHLNGVRSDNRLSNLAWGTSFENEADKQRHGTVARGERQGSSKLSTNDVVAIRQRYLTGESKQSIACSLGVTRETVRKITAGESWCHVTGGSALR